MKPLSVRERAFIINYIKGSSLTASYQLLKPEVSAEVASTLGSRLFRRIVRKADFKGIMVAAGLDDFRLARELEAALQATKKIYFEGKEIAEVPDNRTRMDALVLLADLHGRRRAELTIHEDIVQIVPPPKPEELPGEEAGDGA